MRDKLTQRACSAKRESKQLDFKSQCDLSQVSHWCELIKDLVAMANSSGGIIVFGINDDGSPCNAFQDCISSLDPAEITDKVYKYTGVHFAAFEITVVPRGEVQRPAIIVGVADYPLVFTSPGNYQIDAQKQKQKHAFVQGAVYFRHGAKSEPATPDDIRDSFERLLQSARRNWMKGIRKVVETPHGVPVTVFRGSPQLSDNGNATPVRLTADASAPAFSAPSLAKSHPFRQTEVIKELKSRLGASVHLNSHTIVCVRRVHAVDGNTQFSYKPPFGSRLYSHAFIDWLIREYSRDDAFLDKTVAQYKERKTG